MSARISPLSSSNALSNQLDGTITDSDTSLTLSDASNFPTSGYLVVDRVNEAGTATPDQREYIYYSGKSTNTLTGLTRGQGGSSAQEHLSGAIVEEVFTVGHWNDMKDAFEAEHENNGTHSADAIDAITEIASGLKSGNDTTLVTGTAGTDGYTAKWNADGDLVDGYEVLDEDDMVSDSATKLATQQSIKAYVDANAAATFVGVKAKRSSSQAITTATVTNVQFNAEDFDTDTFHDNTTNPDRITIPVGKAGKYSVSYGIQFANNATGLRSTKITVNGNDGPYASMRSHTPASGDQHSHNGTCIIDLSEGDIVRVTAYHTVGSDLNVQTDNTFLSIYKID